MKAIFHTKFGPADELQLKEVEKPKPKSNEVLIKIRASTVTSSDCNMRNFTFVPKLFLLPARLFMFGVFKPRVNRLGSDLAGEVEAVGENVTRFQKGDHVFGSSEPQYGTHAEYICLPEDGVLTAKPDDVTWEEAASVALAGSTALYFIRDLAHVQPGQKVLINGASGAIGTFAVQLAKYYGAEVTGICSTTNLEMVKAVGADRVIDYTKEDFTRREDTYDVIFDVVGKTSFTRCKHLLQPNGIFLVNLIEVADLVQMVWTSLVGGKKAKGGMAVARLADLVFLKELIAAGKIKPVIDRCYPLAETAAAFTYVEKGHKKGNVVLAMAQ